MTKTCSMINFSAAEKSTMETLTQYNISASFVFIKGVPRWYSRLKIQHCHCSVVGSIPGQECPHASGSAKKKKRKKKEKEREENTLKQLFVHPCLQHFPQ